MPNNNNNNNNKKGGKKQPQQQSPQPAANKPSGTKATSTPVLAPASPPAAAAADRDSPVTHKLAALIDEHNARHRSDGEPLLQLYAVGPAAADSVEISSSGVKRPSPLSAAAVAERVPPEALAPPPQRVGFRRVGTAPEELTKLLSHSGESDDSLFGRSGALLLTPVPRANNFNVASASAAAAASPASAPTVGAKAATFESASPRSPPRGDGGGGSPSARPHIAVRNKSFDLGSGGSVFSASKPRVAAGKSASGNNSSGGGGGGRGATRTDAQRREQQQQQEEEEAEEEDPFAAMPVKGSFLPLLALPQKDRDEIAAPQGTDAASRTNTLLRLVGGLVLVRRVQWHNVLLAVASYVYVPLIAALCITTANAVLAVGAHAILPVIEFNPIVFEADASSSAAAAASDGAASAIPTSLTDAQAAASAAMYSFFAHLGGPQQDAAASITGSAAATATTTAAATMPMTTTTATTSHETAATFGAVLGVCMSSCASLLLVVGAATMGYKASSMCGDAFLDSARIVVDRRSGLTLYLFSLYSDIVRIFHLGWKWVAVFTALLVGIPTLCLLQVFAGSFRAVATRPAFLAAIAALMLEVLWLIFQIVRFLLRLTKPQQSKASSASSPVSSPTTAAAVGNSPLFFGQTPPTSRVASPLGTSGGNRTDELADQLLVWWSRKIVKMRKRNFFLLFLTSCAVIVGSGLLNGVISLAEGLLYASALHLAAHIAARTTLFLRAVRVALRTLASNAAALVSALIVMPVFITVASINAYRFGFGLALIQLPVLVLALCSIASHAQDRKEQHDRDRAARRRRALPLPRGNNSAASASQQQQQQQNDAAEEEEEGTSRLFSDLSFILWRVLLMNPRSTFAYGIHWKYARYFRVLLRIVITVFASAVTIVTTWTAMQAIQFRFQAYQSELVTVQDLPGGGLRTHTDSFSLTLRPLQPLNGGDAAATGGGGGNATRRRKKSRHYRAMCQRRWWLASGHDSPEVNGPDNDDEEPAGDVAAKSVRERTAPTAGAALAGDDDDRAFELAWVDMAFFSMLAYVAPIDAQQSQRKLFDFYRRHRVGAADWQIGNPMQMVWEPLLAEVQDGNSNSSSDASPLTKQERAEARELLRWSRLHMAQSLRPPFLHFSRTRIKKLASGETRTIEEALYVMRGTELAFASDLFQNMIIFADLFLIEQLAHLVPGVGLLPLEFVRDLVSATSGLATVPETLFHHAHLRRYMRAHQLLGAARRRRAAASAAARGGASASSSSSSSWTSYELKSICAGHSHGGVVSQLAAPALHIPAVAISAPGTLFLSAKFGVSALETESFVSNLVPTRDIIPLIGSLNGEVHNVACEHESSLLCHSIQLTMHRMMRHCESHRLLFPVETSYEVRVNELSKLLQRANKWLEDVLGFELQF